MRRQLPVPRLLHPRRREAVSHDHQPPRWHRPHMLQGPSRTLARREDATRSVAKDSRQRSGRQSRNGHRRRCACSRGSAGPAAAVPRCTVPQCKELGWKRKAAALSDGSATTAAAALPLTGNTRAKQQKAAAAAAAKAFVRAPRFDAASPRRLEPSGQSSSWRPGRLLRHRSASGAMHRW